MSEATAPTQEHTRRTAAETARDVSNPATIKGAIAVAAGLLIILIPDLSLTIVEYVGGIALVAIGLYDVWFALTGHGERDRGSRLLALARGLASAVVGLLVLVTSKASISVLLVILGIYLIVRGLLSLVGAVLSRDSSRRSARFTIGAAGLAFGVLALAVPDSLSQGVIVGGAVTFMVVGGILLAYGLRVGAPAAAEVNVNTASTSELVWDWVRATDIGAERREALADTLYFEQPNRAAKLAAWWVMLLLSVSIATFAVLQDSTAVVIGAMLIAPLMTPILGLGGAIVNGWRRRAAASTLLVAAGVAGAVGLSLVIASWVPALVSFESNSQIISRVSPTFVDMLIALAAGAAGAFATVNTRVASSIAGVAIAVALVPPLSVVGVSLEAQRWDDATGALLLFTTNFVSIVLAAAAVFVLSGFAESTKLRTNNRQVLSTLAPFGSIALVILVPLVFTGEGILATATQEKTAQEVVNDWLGDDSALRVGQVTVGDGLVSVELAGTEVPPSPSALQRDLSEALGIDVRVAIEYTPTALITVSEDGQVVRQDSRSG